MNTQEQLIEMVTQDILKFISVDKNLGWKDAMQMFYHSATFDKLNDIDTGLYRESSAYVYDLFLNEVKNGKILQEEI